MIEQIKQRLELGLIDIDISHKEVYEWLRYLIGEVERLQYERGLLSLKLHGELKKERNQLQKALEELVHLMDLTGLLKITQEYKDAVQLLQSIQGGNTP